MRDQVISECEMALDVQRTLFKNVQMVRPSSIAIHLSKIAPAFYAVSAHGLISKAFKRAYFRVCIREIADYAKKVDYRFRQDARDCRAADMVDLGGRIPERAFDCRRLIGESFLPALIMRNDKCDHVQIMSYPCWMGNVCSIAFVGQKSIATTYAPKTIVCGG